MRGGTLFSGIGAPELAAPWVDWRWCAEIDRFASAVHAARHGTRNLGDVERVDWNAVEPIDILVFGSPCQSFSVAGKRLGLDDPRGNLALVALRVAAILRPRWLVFENVPGLLSSDGGRDFGAFLGLLGECGYGWAYRVLDAQHFGVPQRRRRVFLVGYLGDWRYPASVLFEPESLRGDPAPRRAPREGVARPLAAGSPRGSGYRNDADTAENLIAGTLAASGKAAGKDSGLRNYAFGGNNTAGPIDVAAAVNAHGGPHGRLDFESETFIAHSLRAEGFDASEDGTGRGTPLVPVAFTQNSRSEVRQIGGDGKIVGALAADHGVQQQNYIAFSGRERGDDGRGYARPPSSMADRVGAIDTVKPWNVASGSAVRRLTPRECERLQGFPDDFTLVPYRGKPAADGPRYRALGNSMAVPVVRWIMDRLRVAA